MKKRKQKEDPMDTTFDNVVDALNFFDSLPKAQRAKARLSNVLIEGEYDKRGVLQQGLYEWHVNQ